MLSNYFLPNRYYHNFDHIVDCLSRLTEMIEVYDSKITHKEELIQAVIWHDVVYEILGSHNEIQSAVMAVEANPTLSSSVLIDIILATKHDKQEFNTIEEKIIADIDLGVLGSSYEEFEKNTYKIRREFSMFNDAEWKIGRSDFYRKMLSRPRIFHTQLYRGRYEEKAIRNLNQGILDLSGSNYERKTTKD